MVQRTHNTVAVLTYLIPGTLMAAMIGALMLAQANAEAALAHFANALPVGFAVAAGMVASVNPCGFFILPSYIAYQLGTHEAGFDQRPVPLRITRAVLVGLATTLGFVLIFAAVGAAISAGVGFLIRIFPVLGLAVGVLMVGFGGYLLVAHRYVGILAASRIEVTPRRNLTNAFVFGVSYAIGSLGCTLPIFMVVTGSALATEGFFHSLGQFLAYAVGMGVVVIAATIGAAIFRDAVARWLKGVVPYVHRASAFFVLGAGVYLIWYWLVFAGFPWQFMTP